MNRGGHVYVSWIARKYHGYNAGAGGNSMVVVVDDRENNRLIHRLFVKLGDHSQDEDGKVQVKRLQVGDYIIGDIGVEAKEINDLWKSIMGIGRTRTINAQLADLCETFERPMLVVYGNQVKVYRKKKGNPRREIARAHAVMKSFKLSLYHRFPKIQFMQVPTMDDFVDWVVYTHEQQRIGQHLTMPGVVKRYRSMSDDPRIIALASLPGMTERHAEDLLKEFGSIPKILRSKVTQKSLMEIRGVGRSKAKMIQGLRDEFEVKE